MKRFGKIIIADQWADQANVVFFDVVGNQAVRLVRNVDN